MPVQITDFILKKNIKPRLELAVTLAISNVKIRYKNSILGFVWSLLTPLIYLLIFVTIFSQRLGIDRYPLYALSGLIFWNFFNTTVNQVLHSVVGGAGILKSMNVPTLIFPISAIGSSLINLILSFIPFFGLMLFFGFEPSLASFQFIYILLMFCFFTLGFGMILCAYNVYFRDVGMLWGTITPALFYFTPIVWQYQMLDKDSLTAKVILFNPIHHFMTAFRSALYTNEWMSWDQVTIITGLGVLILLVGYKVFTNLEKGFYSHY